MEEAWTSDPVTLDGSGHALNNSLVLQMIFRQLAKSGSFQDLKNARLVTNATNWQEEMQKVWRKEAVLVLRDVGILQAPPKVSHVAMINFIREFENPGSPYELQTVPYERIKITYSKVNVALAEEPCLAKTFWNTVGPTVKHLKIKNFSFCFKNCAIRPAQGAYPVIRFLRDKLPNLESLSLDGISIVSDLYDSESDMKQEDLPVLPKLKVLHAGSMYWDLQQELKLSRLPNLQKLKLTKSMDLENCMDRGLAEVQVNSSVKHLELRYLEPSEILHFSVLQTLKARLPFDANATNRFIHNHAATLTRLDLYRGIGTFPDANPIGYPFPVLKEFRAWGNVVTDLSFLRFTPNLQTLHLDPYGYEKQRWMKEEYKIQRQNRWGDPGFSLATSQRLIGSVEESGLMAEVELPKLTYLQINCEVRPEDVRTLGKWMPNVKTFKAVLNWDSFDEMCACWKELEHLECMFGSGIPNMSIAPPRKSTKYKKKSQQQHSLTELKKLKTFRCSPGMYEMSNEAVKRGILSLPHLTNLEIFTVHQISVKTEKMCRDRIQNVKIHKSPDLGKVYKSNREYKCYIYSTKPPVVDSDGNSSGSEDF